jgi:hypothetical protein
MSWKIGAMALALLLSGCDSDSQKDYRELAYEVGWTCRDRGIPLQECKDDYYRIKAGGHSKSFRGAP